MALFIASLLTTTATDASSQESVSPITDDGFYRAAYEGNTEVVRQYLAQGSLDPAIVDPECPPRTRCRPLSFAAERGHRDVVDLLLEAGVAVNASEGHGDTALFYAQMGEHHDVIRLLVSYGADVNHRNLFNATPFMAASAGGHHELVALYLEHGAEPTDRFPFNDRQVGQIVHNVSALMLAVRSGNAPTVSLLVAAGLDRDALDALGRSAADYTLGDESADAVAALVGGSHVMEIPAEPKRPKR